MLNAENKQPAQLKYRSTCRTFLKKRLISFPKPCSIQEKAIKYIKWHMRQQMAYSEVLDEKEHKNRTYHQVLPS